MIGKLHAPQYEGATDVRVHDSLSAMLQECKPREGYSASMENAHRTDWAGTATYAEALTMARDGWPEGREKVTALTGGLVAALAGRIMREDWVHDVTGSFVDVAAFVNQEPECWVAPTEMEGIGTARRHIRILYNPSVSCAVSRESIERRGAAVAALCDLLELAGHQVSLDILFCGGGFHNARGGFAEFFPLKRSNDRMDLGLIMFYLAHPAAFRRIGFALYEGWESAEKRRKFGVDPTDSRYSMPSDPDPKTLPEDVDVYFGAGQIGDADWNSPATVQRWLESTLGQLGVTLKAAD